MSERIYVVIVKPDYKVNIKAKERRELITKLREELTTLWHNIWHSMSTYYTFTNGVIAIAGRYFVTLETLDKGDVIYDMMVRLKTNDLTFLNYAIGKIKEVVESDSTRKLRIVVPKDDCDDLMEIDMNIMKVKGKK